VKVSGVFRNADSIIEVAAGDVIFEEGDPGDSMLGIIAGTVEIRTSHGSTRILGPNDTFGEMSIVDFSPRSATARAATDTSLAVIDRKTFLFLVHETPMFALQVMSSIAERLRDIT
jgi:CRP/FNR family transcriptional regulator, cyclic AMP receptor protein